MALPVVSTPTFTTKVPSTGEEIEYRPFLVKEEKTLLIALEGNDTKEIINAVSNLLKECIYSDIDVNKLATFDVEYLFLKLRGKSVGEVISLTIGHNDDNECKGRTDIQINIDDIQVQGEIKDSKIMLNDDLGIQVKYPSINALQQNMDTTEAIFGFIADNIECVFDSTNIYNDFSNEEMHEWLGTLNQSQFEKIANWYQSMPTLRHDVEWTCSACGEKDKVSLEGLQSFFT